ncbi:MAG TPA: recombinase family protein [Nitrospiraceae bacterium]|nr:recombinase family protein [Nitrospiraceae bacterium]
MAVIGYARSGKDLESQIAQLKASGCRTVRIEARSRTAPAECQELSAAVKHLKPGDTLIATRLDCLAHSIGDLQAVVRSVRSKKAHLRVLAQHVDTRATSGKWFIKMLDIFAVFEASLHRERQALSAARSRTAGKYLRGRPRSIDVEAALQLKSDGLRVSEIATRLGVSRSTVYRSTKS